MGKKKGGRNSESSIILDGFRCCANLQSMKDQWWADKYIVNTMCLFGGDLAAILNKDDQSKVLRQFNTAITQCEEFSDIASMFPHNSSAFHRMTFKHNKKMVQFYYFSSDVSVAPSPVLNFDLSQGIYVKELPRRSERQSKRQRCLVEEEEDANGDDELIDSDGLTMDTTCVQNIEQQEGEEGTNSRTETSSFVSISPPQSNQPSEALTSLTYWNSANAAKLFGVAVDDNNLPIDCVQTVVKSFVEICNRKALESIGSEISLKYYLLKKSYEIALQKMPVPFVQWYQCCIEAMQILNDAGVPTVTSHRTVARWNQYFRKNLRLEMDPLYKVKKMYEPILFSHYPEARAMINNHFGKKTETLSVETFRLYILDNLVPQLLAKLKENNLTISNDNDDAVDDLTKEEYFLQSMGMKSFSLSTAHKYLTYLGYKYEQQKKCYYNDGHEKAENVSYRNIFIKKVFKQEVNQYVWIQLQESIAIELEKDANIPLLKAVYHPFVKDAVAMREYHVDLHPSFANYIDEENLKYGGNLSVRRTSIRPLVVVGQDESSFSQYSFSSKAWYAPNGRSQLLPKSAGETLMVSCFQSRLFGLGVPSLSEEELIKINIFRREIRPEYISVDSAKNVLGYTKKDDLKDDSAFSRFFEVGVDKDGFWNFDHMALQLEDVVDCLQVLYPTHDFCFFFDQSSGHGKKKPDGLNVVGMNVNWGGVQKVMHPTILTEGCFGPFQRTLSVGDTQNLAFCENDEGPFNMTPEERILRRNEQQTLTTVTRQRTKKELMQKLLEKGFKPTRKYTKDQLQQIATVTFNIELETTINKKIEGWVDKPKGILQVLYERGFIDHERSLSDYSLLGKNGWKDDSGQILPQYLPFCLRHLLSECDDFKNESTALEELASALSINNESSIEIIYTPRYHCEIAGDGIEYSWGMAQKIFRNLALDKKKKLSMFRSSVRSSIKKVTIASTRKFAALTRRYMLAYLHYCNQIENNRNNNTEEQSNPSYSDIERFVKKKSKTHRNVADQDVAAITKVWRESMLLPPTTNTESSEL